MKNYGGRNGQTIACIHVHEHVHVYLLNAGLRLDNPLPTAAGRRVTLSQMFLKYSTFYLCDLIDFNETDLFCLHVCVRVV